MAAHIVGSNGHTSETSFVSQYVQIQFALFTRLNTNTLSLSLSLHQADVVAPRFFRKMLPQVKKCRYFFPLCPQLCDHEVRFSREFLGFFTELAWQYFVAVQKFSFIKRRLFAVKLCMGEHMHGRASLAVKTHVQ